MIVCNIQVINSKILVIIRNMYVIVCKRQKKTHYDIQNNNLKNNNPNL